MEKRMRKLTDRIKDAERAGEQIQKLVNDEYRLKSELKEETKKQQRRLAEIRRDVETLRRGGPSGVAP